VEPGAGTERTSSEQKDPGKSGRASRRKETEMSEEKKLRLTETVSGAG